MIILILIPMRPVSAIALPWIAAALIAGCAAPKPGPKPADNWLAMDSGKRQEKLQLSPAFDSRILRYNKGQIEFVERRPALRALEEGETPAPPLVYVHGLGGTMGDFGPLILAGEADRDIIALNLPGTGRSTNVQGEYTIRAHAAALYETLMYRMQIGKVDLVCHSLGGQVCMAFALEHPQNVSTLTLIDVAGSYDQGTFVQTMARKYGRINMGTVWVPNHPAIGIVTGGDQAIVNRLVGGDAQLMSALDSFKENYRERIRNLAMPVLIVWGEKDPVFDIQSGFFLLCNLPDARMKVVPEAGHVPQISHPDLVRGWIADFHRAYSHVPAQAGKE